VDYLIPIVSFFGSALVSAVIAALYVGRTVGKVDAINARLSRIEKQHDEEVLPTIYRIRNGGKGEI
jgi:hypothetical protein